MKTGDQFAIHFFCVRVRFLRLLTSPINRQPGFMTPTLGTCLEGLNAQTVASIK